jgi:hypothetical protein
MAFDEHLADRIRTVVGDTIVDEKKMFGGIAFLFDGNMAVGVSDEELMVRVGLEAMDAAAAHDGVRPFEMSGRPMKGWILAGGDAIAEEAGLQYWVDVGLDFAASLPPK